VGRPPDVRPTDEFDEPLTVTTDVAVAVGVADPVTDAVAVAVGRGEVEAVGEADGLPEGPAEAEGLGEADEPGEPDGLGDGDDPSPGICAHASVTLEPTANRSPPITTRSARLAITGLSLRGRPADNKPPRVDELGMT